jgi:hypothetical protein
MTSEVTQVFASETSSGLRQLVGTRVVAAIEMSESVLQDALRSIGEMPRTLRVRVARANRIVLKYGVIHATAVLGESVDLRGPRPEVPFIHENSSPLRLLTAESASAS